MNCHIHFVKYSFASVLSSQKTLVFPHKTPKNICSSPPHKPDSVPIANDNEPRSSISTPHYYDALAAYLRISEPLQLRNLALLRMGFAWPAHHCTAGALLPHHFALIPTVPCGTAGRYLFCCTFRRVTPPGR